MRNSNYTHSEVTAVRMPRTRFPVNQKVITTAKVGYLYPVYCQEIYPCDSFNIDAAWVARSVVPFYRPVMDNLFVDFMYFFVPSRICFDGWEKIFGEGNPSTWIDDENVEAPSSGLAQTVASRSVADYLGLPPGRIPAGLNMIPFRAFAQIYNYWFRDQNLIDETLVQTGNFNPVGEALNDKPWSPSNYTGMPPKVAKLHDYFTGALFEPQRGAPVEVPISGGVLPVQTYAQNLINPNNVTSPMKLGVHPWTLAPAGGQGAHVGIYSSSDAAFGNVYTAGLSVTPDESYSTGNGGVYPINLGVDAKNVGAVTVNTLRLAFQTQKILERTARGGARYHEYIRAAFGCVTSDARMQIPEFLGGKRMPLNVQQATSTQSGENLGDVAGWSLTNGRNGYNKGFTEHGFVIGVMCIRQRHTYSQGIERFWMRKNRFDYYDPALAHIGEQPIYTSEICAATERTMKENIFGYREAFADLRYRQNLVTGQARPQQNAENYYYYSFADDYELTPPGATSLPTGAPVLSEEFINETDEYVVRSMSGMTDEDDQFIFDLNFSGSAIRVLPAHGTPSLIDHY